MKSKLLTICIRSKRATIFSLLLGLMLASAIICTLPALAQGSATVTISTPSNNSKVNHNASVTGNATLPSGQELWLIVYNQAERMYYPQEGPIVPFDGAWYSRAYLGTITEGNGKVYRIITALATTESAKATLASLDMKDEGTKALPDGVTQYQYVTVMRSDGEPIIPDPTPTPSVPPTSTPSVNLTKTGSTTPVDTSSATTTAATIASATASGGIGGLPGFEAVYAVAGLLAVAYLVMRRRK